MKNKEGYYDSTAYHAIRNAGRRNRKAPNREHLTFYLNEVKGFPRKVAARKLSNSDTKMILK